MNNDELAESLKDELSRFPASREIEVTFTRDELTYIVGLLAKAPRPEAAWIKTDEADSLRYINAAPGRPVWFVDGTGQVWLYQLPHLPQTER